MDSVVAYSAWTSVKLDMSQVSWKEVVIETLLKISSLIVR